MREGRPRAGVEDMVRWREGETESWAAEVEAVGRIRSSEGEG